MSSSMKCVKVNSASNPCAYREDLDMQKQFGTVREHRDMVRHKAAMQDWMLTRASRENHRIMLHILISEAEQHNRGNSPTHVIPAAHPRDEFVALHQHVEASMCVQDNYGECLQEIGRLGLFNSNIATPNDSISSSLNNSPSISPKKEDTYA